MSAKNLDKHDRFRCITVGFRVSPEEHETINRIVALSGLTKQEYCYRKCTDREIIVEGNPRVYKALKVELAAILDELKRIESGGNGCKIQRYPFDFAGILPAYDQGRESLGGTRFGVARCSIRANRFGLGRNRR